MKLNFFCFSVLRQAKLGSLKQERIKAKVLILLHLNCTPILVKFLKANATQFPEYLVARNAEDISGASGDYFSGIQFTNGNNRRSYDYKDRFKEINF